MKLTRNISLKELVHPKDYARFGDECNDYLNPNLAKTIQSIRDKCETGKVVINGMYKGVRFVSSGLRLPFSRIGAKLSRHKRGNTADCKFELKTPIQVQAYILKHPDEFTFISRMENAKITKTWLHIEVSTKKRVGKIKVFNP